LIELLKKWPVTAKKYLEMRKWAPEEPDLRAARFLYLNRTCFAGMYRVNQQGHFNVPYGGGDRTPSCLWDRGLLVEASLALQAARVLVADFEGILAKAAVNDLVYCDPAYTVAHNNNGFIRYNEKVFTWEDQERLAAACMRAKGRGARVFVSNAHHKTILGLYPDAIVHTVVRRSLLTPHARKRRLVEEALIEL
jgi:DNA adenine methylase